MQNFENGKTYRLINKADTNGRALNAYSASTPASLTNVCLYTSDVDDDCQKWQYVGTATRGYFVCKANTALALDQYTGTSGGSGVTNYNAHLYEPSSTSYVIPVYTKNSAGEVTSVKLKLECDQTKFLTANENANGTSSGTSVNSNGNVYWYQSAGVTQYSQDWLVEEVGEVKPNPPTGGKTFEIGKSYRFINKADASGRVMKACTTPVPKSLDNVCLCENNINADYQKWVYRKNGTLGYFVCYANTSLALDLYTGSQGTGITDCNAHLYAPSETSYFTSDFEEDSEGNMVVSLMVSHKSKNKYLTANINANGSDLGVNKNDSGNVYWEETSIANSTRQKWIVEEVAVKPNVPTGGETRQSSEYSFEDGKIYRLRCKADSQRRALGVYAYSVPEHYNNICLAQRDINDCTQNWEYRENDNGDAYFVCMANSDLALSKYNGVIGEGINDYNACLFGPSIHSYIIPNYTYASNGDVESVKLILGYDNSKYLTANEGSNGSDSETGVSSNGNIYWHQNSGVTQYSQDWLVEEVEYKLVDGWVKMYSNPAMSTGGRIVNIPSVPTDYDAPDGVIYRFSNRYYWCTSQGPMSKFINPNAYSIIQTEAGSPPEINIGAKRELTDDEGRYWIAVGPNVVNSNHLPTQTPEPEEMYAKGMLDVVLKDGNNKLWYIRAVVGGTKAHTYDNGVIQTWYQYPTNESSQPLYDSAKNYGLVGNEYNGTVAIEFIGPSSVDELNSLGYQIEKIIFYDNEQ